MKKVTQFIKKTLILPLNFLELPVNLYSSLLGLINPNLRHYWLQKISKKNNSLIQKIKHKNTASNKLIFFKLFIPNWI